MNKFNPILLLGFGLACAVWSCQSSATKNQTDSTTVDHHKALSKEPIVKVTPSDTLIIDQRSAVFLEPDSLRIEQRKKSVGEDNFYVGADDYLFYMHQASEYLEKQKIKCLYVKDCKYVQFKRSNGQSNLVKLDTLAELWNIYFFDPLKEAQPIDMVSIEEEYDAYFNKS